MLKKVNDFIFQRLWRRSCRFKSQKCSSFFDVHLCAPTLKIVPPPMCRQPVKELFRTWNSGRRARSRDEELETETEILRDGDMT